MSSPLNSPSLTVEWTLLVSFFLYLLPVCARGGVEAELEEEAPAWSPHGGTTRVRWLGAREVMLLAWEEEGWSRRAEERAWTAAMEGPRASHGPAGANDGELARWPRDAAQGRDGRPPDRPRHCWRPPARCARLPGRPPDHPRRCWRPPDGAPDRRVRPLGRLDTRRNPSAGDGGGRSRVVPSRRQRKNDGRRGGEMDKG
jgi:hypothetical protein